MVTNFGLKQFVLVSYPDALKLDSRISWLSYILDSARYGKTDLSFDDVLEYESELEYSLMRWSLLSLESESLGFDRRDLSLTVQRLNNAFYARLKRLRKRVAEMLVNEESLWFTTLTFTDEVLEKTSSTYRKRLVKQFLNDYPSYIANVDFGKKNGREHYHALIGGMSVIDSNWKKYGFIYNELVPLDLDDVVPVSKYVAKLSNHAVKETAKQNKLIYSRRKRK